MTVSATAPTSLLIQRRLSRPGSGLPPGKREETGISAMDTCPSHDSRASNRHPAASSVAVNATRDHHKDKVYAPARVSATEQDDQINRQDQMISTTRQKDRPRSIRLRTWNHDRRVNYDSAASALLAGEPDGATGGSVVGGRQHAGHLGLVAAASAAASVARTASTHAWECSRSVSSERWVASATLVWLPRLDSAASSS